MNRILTFMRGPLMGTALLLSPQLFAGKLFCDLTGDDRAKNFFFTAFVERYDINWQETSPKRTEVILIGDVVQFLNTHDQALMKSDPDRYLPLLNRLLTPDNFIKVMIDYKLGQTIMERLSSGDNPSLVEKLNQGAYLAETEYSDNAIDFGVRFLLGVPPMWIPSGDENTQNQNLAALNCCFGSRVLQKLQDLESLPMGDNRVKAFLGNRYDLWKSSIRVLPLIHIDSQTAHFELSTEEFELFWDEKTSLRHFMQNIAFYRYHFDFKNRLKVAEILTEFIPVNLPDKNNPGSTRFWEPLDFARLQAQIVMMFEAAYNPHAPIYSLDQVHRIWQQIAENFILKACNSGEELINSLKNGELGVLTNTFTEKEKNDLTLCALHMATKDVLGNPIVPSQTDVIQGQFYGWNSVLARIQLQAIHRLYESYLVLRMDENNAVGRHMMQGTLDTANLLITTVTKYIALWHGKLPTQTPGIHAEQ